MAYNDPTLRARINPDGRGKVETRRHGKHMEYKEYSLGMTNVHLEQGLVYAKIGWGVDGTDIPVSPDVEPFVEMFDISKDINTRASGIYTLKARGQTTVATARVQQADYDKDKVNVYVSGKNRKDVVKLFELIRDGKIRPDIEHGEFEQIEGALGELRRLRRQNPALERQVAARDESIRALKEQLANVRSELADAQAAAARR